MIEVKDVVVTNLVETKAVEIKVVEIKVVRAITAVGDLREPMVEGAINHKMHQDDVVNLTTQIKLKTKLKTKGIVKKLNVSLKVIKQIRMRNREILAHLDQILIAVVAKKQTDLKKKILIFNKEFYTD